MLSPLSSSSPMMSGAGHSHLSSVQMELAYHQQEVARLQSIIAEHEHSSDPSSPSSSSLSLSSPPTLPLSTRLNVSSVSPSHPFPSSPLPRRFLDEPWAHSSTLHTSSSTLPWAHQPIPFARPPILPHDPFRSTIAATFSAAAIPAEELLTRLCQLARTIFGVPWAAVAIVEENFVHLRASDTVHPPLVGVRNVPRVVSLCNWVLAKRSTLVIPDMSADLELRCNPVCKDFGCKFYAAAPLMTAEGVELGTFCVMDSRALGEAELRFDAASEAILELMAAAVMTQLELVHAKQKRDSFQQQVLATLSHELRTPIHGIIGLCDTFAVDHAASPALSAGLSEIKGEATAMSSLVNDVLDVVKLETSQLALTGFHFSPAHIMQDLFNTLAPSAAESEIHLRLLHPYASSSSTSSSHSPTPSLSLTSTSSSTVAYQGDVMRVRQILLNLLGNAVKFSRPQHAVELRVRHLEHWPVDGLQPSNPKYFHHSPVLSPPPPPDPAAFYLLVEVADAGPGIPSTRLSHVFSPLVGDVDGLSRRFDGAGLGLGLCRMLVELMKGLMMVESMEGDGSVFHVLIPLRWAGPDPATRAALAAWEPPPRGTLRPAGMQTPDRRSGRRLINFNLSGGDSRANSAPLPSRALEGVGRVGVVGEVGQGAGVVGGGRAVSAVVSPGPPRPRHMGSPQVHPQLTVLIVDDNAVNLKVAARMLQGGAYIPLCASGGYQALELILSRPIAVVLMDLQMPEMDGLECTRQIRTMEQSGRLPTGGRARLPIIALTASAGADVELLCRKEGMDGCMFKPCGKALMLDTIAEALQAHMRDSP